MTCEWCSQVLLVSGVSKVEMLVPGLVRNRAEPGSAVSTVAVVM